MGCAGSVQADAEPRPVGTKPSADTVPTQTATPTTVGGILASVQRVGGADVRPLRSNCLSHIPRLMKRPVRWMRNGRAP